ncbi:MAG TPA: sugar phosphate isomerase/epimerase family protein [Candidatus Acidoferrales bacterium]|nr:sugar phosphate isomerase/epimerase family protein [Candidatus Acidoferrales bacterium]
MAATGGAMVAGAAAGALPGPATGAAGVSPERDGRVARGIESPFRVAVINDEISQDFGRACEVASKEFGMRWIELRGMWNKNIVSLDEKDVAEAKKILLQSGLRATDIASPLFKVDWPGAPKSKFSPKGSQFNADFSYEKQDEVLERAIAMADAFGTDRIRCFDFWRLEDPAPYRKAMNERLRQAAEKTAKSGKILVLENEMDCNTATGAEAARTLSEVTARDFMLNWDPGNAAAAGEIPYPDGYSHLPKERIGHCHCKDVVKKPGGGTEWAAMGKGLIDWTGQFRALASDGYHYAVSLETHWRGAGTAEESTRQSWAGMKEELERAGANRSGEKT